MDEPILALEGALGGFSVGLGRDGAVLARELEGREALERGLVLIEELLAEARLDLRDLGGIAVGTGPGTFTGLRIALAYAKSLAFGANRPLGSASSFEILDAAAGAADRVPRLTVVQGRPGVVCIRRTDAGGSQVACGPIEATVARVVHADPELALVGATEDVRDAVGKRGTSVLIMPRGAELPAATLARLARVRAAAGSAHAVAPDYGELPAARLRARS